MKHIDRRLFVKKHWAVVTLTIICCLFALLLFEDKAQLIVEMTSAGENTIQIFWATEKTGYAEKLSLTKKTATGKRNYYFPMENFSKLRKIRIDPQSEDRGKTPEPVVIHSIRLKNKGIKEIVFSSGESFSDLIPTWNISSSVYEPGNGLKLSFDGNDPQLEFTIDRQTKWSIVMVPALMLILLHWFLSSSPNKGSKNRVISYVQLKKKPSVRVLNDLVTLFKEKKLFVRQLYCTETENSMTAYFLLALPDPASFSAAINDFQHKGELVRSGITYQRSGEIL